jgi:acyl carrier protein
MSGSAEERRRRIRDFVVHDLLNEPDLDLSGDEALFSSGLVDSFSAVRLLAFLQAEFKTRIDGVGLEDLDTLDKCAALTDGVSD